MITFIEISLQFFFLGLKKAFDTVCHKTLIKKLNHYRLRGPVNKLLNSYLLRHQFVSLNNTHARIRLNGYGVPQGLSLGPLLFLLYVNDLPNAVQSVPQLFSDDTCLLLSHSKPLTLQEKLNQEVSLLCNWCNSNKLTINIEKCRVIIISPKINSNVKDFSVTLNNSPITLKNHVKYLGVFVDSKLNFIFI